MAAEEVITSHFASLLHMISETKKIFDMKPQKTLKPNEQDWLG